MKQLSFTNWLLRTTDLVLVLLLAYFIPKVAYIAASRWSGFFSGIDPDNVFAWNYIHHIVQMVLALVVILLPIWKKPLAEWGFNLNNKTWSLKAVGRFCIGWIIIIPLGTLVFQLISGWPNIVNHSLNARNIIGNLSYMFIMPGISEEVLFRALVMGVLLRSWTGKIKIKSFELSHAGLIAAIIFTLAHVGFAFHPFRIDYIEPMQLVFAFGLGVFYAVMFDRTGSLLGPVLVHNAADGIGTVIYLLFSLGSGS